MVGLFLPLVVFLLEVSEGECAVISGICSRGEVEEADTWDLTPLFSSFTAWEKDLQSILQVNSLELATSPFEERFRKFKGTLQHGKENLIAFLSEREKVERHLEVLYVYAHLRHDEDVSETEAKAALQKITNCLHDFSLSISWFIPEFLSLDSAIVEKYLQSPEMQGFQVYLRRLLHRKPYTLSEAQEALFARLSKTFETPSKAFTALQNADFLFPGVEDSTGRQLTLTHGTYSVYIRTEDPLLRKNTFQTLHRKFAEHENTFAELLLGQVTQTVVEAEARGFASSLASALFPHEIDTQVYMQLIETVRSNLSSLHQYMDMRKKWLKLKELQVWDLYVPLIGSVNVQYTYEEAVDIIVASTAILGDEYQEQLKEGLTTHRWVDRFENAQKRSGAYSSGCFDSKPYILMNFHGSFQDMVTLAHEAGHSMHSLYSRKNQPHMYAEYPIFLAEVASTFSEDLLFQHLLKQNIPQDLQDYIKDQQLERVRSTLFRQTMFAEFELAIHEFVENGVPLTPKVLKECFIRLNKDYLGPAVVLDPLLSAEWSRIPHFYHSFYVYQYATGISAAHFLSQNLLSSGDPSNYLRFISSGCSKSPLETLFDSGVDMQGVEPIVSLIKSFNNNVNYFLSGGSFQ